MTGYNFQFCSTFAYPARIQQQLLRILELIIESGLDIDSVLLVGSTARGELSYLLGEKTFRLFSDYEFLLITPQEVEPRQRELLELKVNQLGELLNPNNPLFHIDLGWYVLPQLPHLPHTIALFEQKETGKFVFGPDYRHLMPHITVASLDKKNANEILYKRLWALLLYLPQQFYYSQLTPESTQVTTYILARNALDLTTVLLPYEGVLLPTYAQRVEYLTTNYERLNLSSSFGLDLPRFLTDCLACRQTLSWDGLLIDLYKKTVAYLEKAIGYLLAKQENRASGVSDLIQTGSHLLFHDNLPKRAKVRGARQMLLGRKSFYKAYQWAWLPHKGLLTACLLQIHRAMIAHLSGKESEAWGAFSDAQTRLDALISRPLSALDPDNSFLANWLSLRRDVGYFWWEFMRRRRPIFYERIQTLTEPT